MTDHDDEDADYERPEARRRVRIPLDGGHMDVCLRPDASPETIAALTALGQAAVARMVKKPPSPSDLTNTPRP